MSMETTSAGRQRERAQRSSPELLFGYSFQGAHDAPYDPPPAPAPGPALLDDNDSHMLESFFNTMNSNHLENGELLFNGSHQPREPGDLPYDWVDDLPPIFEGSTTSLPQSSSLSQNMHLGHDPFLGMNQGADMATASPEILAAASMLYQNGQINGGEMGSMYHAQSFPGSLHGSHPNANGHVRRRETPNGMLAQATPVSTKPTLYTEHANMATNMYFPGADAVSFEHRIPNKVGDLRWGSDASFIGPGYVAPPNQETEEQVTKNLLQHMDCLEPQSSANNTRPASPVTTRHEPVREAARGSKNRDSGSQTKVDEEVDEENIRPRKRIKNREQAVEDDSEDFETFPATSKKGKTNSKNRNIPSSSHTQSKRRKLLASNAKNPRENLSEEQKRSNHILSEQKRRNLIKQGFEDLCDLVPELQGGGFSKSAMLIQAADYLEEILHGNEELRSQLIDLKRVDDHGGYG